MKTQAIETPPLRQRQQPTTERKPGVKWPTQGDKKSWELFDGDLDTILSVALRVEVDRKIRTLTAITYAVGKDREVWHSRKENPKASEA